MKVGIDISSTKVNGAGTTTYVRELSAALDGLDVTVEIETLCYSPIFSRKRTLLRKIDAINRDIFWELFYLPYLAEKKQIDALHCPAMIAPLKYKKPIVLTVLDVYVFKHPEYSSFWNRELVQRLMPGSLKRADKIISISEFTKTELMTLFPDIAEDKITVTHLGVSSRFRIVGESLKSVVRRKYHLEKPFFLTVSTIEPRKNLANVLKAFSLICDKVNQELVLVGAYGWNSAGLFTLIKELGIENRIRFIGYVDSDDLPILYNLADVFLYPSLYEGFGLPILEAMASGCPVITSNCSSMPEVAGDGALLVDPLDPANIAESIIMLIGDTALQGELQASGLCRASQFSWRSCAEKTLEVYQEFA